MKRTISALQLGAAPEGKQATLDRLINYEAEIRASGSSLVVLPEALLGGYPKGRSFGTRVGYRLPEGRQAFADYAANAVEVPGPETTALAAISARTGAYIVIGVVERERASLYCTVLYFEPTKGLVAKRRKLMPTAAERLIWGQGTGADLSICPSPFGTIGAAICWENYMPLLRAAMYAKGVSIWCAPTVDDRPLWIDSMRHIATEGRCFLVSACQLVGTPSELGVEALGWDADKPFVRGGSVIVSPLGEILAGPLYDASGLIHAEIDPEDIARSRFDFDPVGHYSRPDIFTLTVHERNAPGIDFRQIETD